MRSSSRLFLAIIMVSSLFFTNNSFADNPNNFKRRMSLIKLISTSQGRSLVSMALCYSDKKHCKKLSDDDLMGFLAYYTMGDISTQPKRFYELLVKNSKAHIHLNGNLIGASPTYISWVLAQAMSEVIVYNVARQKRSPRLGDFLEKSFIGYIYAGRHWVQLGTPKGHDYTKDTQGNKSDFPKSLDGSVSKYNTLWSKPDIADYLDSVETRYYKLDYTKKTLTDLLNSNNPGTRKAAEKIETILLNLINVECRKDHRVCS